MTSVSIPTARPSTSKRPKGLLTAASIAVALAAADTYVVVLAITDMMSGVGLSIDELQKATPIISGFLLGYVAVLPLIGRLSDLVSRQRILLLCLGIFVVGSCITALATDLPTLIGGRVVQGIGGGGLVPGTLALVADLWPRGKRGTPLGIVGAVQELGSVLGPLLGALILVIADWRMIFWVNAILGVVLAISIRAIGGPQPLADSTRKVPLWWGWLTGLVALAAGVLFWLALAAPDFLAQSVQWWGAAFVPYGDHTARLFTPIGVWATIAIVLAVLLSSRYWWPILRQVDLVGALLMAVFLGCIVLTFSTTNPEKQVVGPMGLWLLPVAVIAAVLFFVRQRTAAVPLISKGTVVGRVIPALVASLLVGASLVAVIVDVPLLARLTSDGGETEAAFVLVRFLFAVPVGALIGGYLLRRFGPAQIASVGLVVAGLGLISMSTWGFGSLESWVSWSVLILVGLGFGAAIAPVNDAALADATEEAHGVVSSLVVVCRMIGMVLGLALLTAIGLHRFYGQIESMSNPSVRQLAEAGVVQCQTVFFGAGVLALIAAGVCWFLGRERIAVPEDATPFL